MIEEAPYECKHCRHRFKSERVWIKHECTPMVRAKQIQTIAGRQAYELYKFWLEKQKRKAPPIETFCTSSYYTSFYKFAEWVQQTGVPRPEKYVELMVSKKIAPALWRRAEAYQIFLEWNDNSATPLDQAAVAIETIATLAEGLECSPADVFKHLMVGEVLELVHQRRMTPWLLFCSRSFKKWVESLGEGDRAALMRGIGVDFWAHRLESKPGVVRDLREIAESMGI